MKKTKMLKKAAVSWLVLLFIFSPLNLDLFNCFKIVRGFYEYEGAIYIDEDETWHKGDELIFDKTIIVENGATLNIEPGTIIKFKRNSNWEAPTLNILGGNILAKGTQEEPIIFTTESAEDSFFINFENTPDRLTEAVDSSFFRYVEINGGGEEYGSGPIQGYQKPSFFATALAADDGSGVFYYQGGKMHIENSRFLNNKYADIEVMADNGQDNPDDYLEVVNSNFEGTPDQFAVKSNLDCWRFYNDSACVSDVILKDNWYGEVSGPTQDDSLTPKGKKITGQYELLGWKFNDMRNDPVVIMPGITGSAEVDGRWEMDPITHTYDNLIESLVRNGYAKDKNLFEFPYDWKNNNETTASNLKTKIEEIIDTTKVSKVDLVAHSMGGLIARAYIERNDYNLGSVDQLITLGTPHHGAPKAYLQWEAGEGFLFLIDLIAKHHFTQEAKHNGYSSLYEYIKAKVPAIAELLPDYNYLFNANDQSIRSYPDNYPRNTFLETLNQTQNEEKLNQVDFTNIIGDTENGKTISGIRVGEKGSDGLWENGMPENFYNSNTDRGLNYSSGDMTVPLFSASDITANKSVTVESSHNDLPTKAQCDVFAELTGKPKEDCQYTTVFNIANIFLINVFSPIDIQVVAPDGKRVGKDFDTGEIFNEISGAYYSGYDTDSEVIAIPNPEEGEYRILTQGTGNGEYRVDMSRITEEENDANVATEISGSIQGQATSGQKEEKVVILSEEDIELPVVLISIDQLIKKVEQYFKSGLIKKNTAKSILSSLKALKWQNEKIKVLENSKLSQKQKQKTLAVLKKTFNYQVNILVNYVNQSAKKKQIDASIKDALLQNILSLKKT